MTRFFRSASTALLMGALLAACGGGGGLGDTGGSVRLVNATPDFAALELSESNNRIVSATAQSAASGYADLNDETYTFDLQSTGSTTVAASVSGTIERRKHATVVAYTTGVALKAAFLTDEEASPASGTAKLRVFNAANAEAGTVDVYLVGSDCSALESVSVAAAASNVSTLQTSYTQVNAATYHLCVTATGDKSDVRLDIPAFALTDRQIVTLILVKTPGGVLLNGLALDQQGPLALKSNTSARLRVAAGASALGTVGATVNGVALGNYASPEVGGYTLVPAGTLSVQLTINGTTLPSGTPIAATTAVPTAAAGADLTLLVTGTAAAPMISLLVDDNTPSTSASKPVKIRLVNGFAGSGTVTLSVDGTNVGSGAGPNAASATALVASSSQGTRLKATSPNGQLYLTDNNTLAAGSVYSLFLLGDPPTVLPAAATGILRHYP